MMKIFKRDGDILSTVKSIATRIRERVKRADGLLSKKLLTVGNPKTAKGEKLGYLTAILHLAASDISGFNVCQFATEGCRAACLMFAGRGGIAKRGQALNTIARARIRKTAELFYHRTEFVLRLKREIENHVRNAARHGLRAAVRMNGTSDLPWESMTSIMQSARDTQFYDYTKSLKRYAAYLSAREFNAFGVFPANYHLTYSHSERDTIYASAQLVRIGGNVAIVGFGPMPDTILGLPVASGDVTDLRFLDSPGTWIWLTAKGPAKRDQSGFVYRAVTA